LTDGLTLVDVSISVDKGSVAGGDSFVVTGVNFAVPDGEYNQSGVAFWLVESGVTVATAEASCVVDSDTQMTCETPPFVAGAADVLVFSNTGTMWRRLVDGFYFGELSLSLSVDSVAFSVAPGGNVGADYTVATVWTDNPSGYELSLEADGAELVCKDNGSYTIPSIASDGALTVASGKHGAWGWNISTVPIEPSSWRVIPFGAPALMASTSAVSALNGDEYNLFFGAVVDYGQPACEYRQVLTITVVAN
jgi:hypothetical protein